MELESGCFGRIPLRPPRTGLANDAFRITYTSDDASAQIVAITLTGPGVAAGTRLAAHANGVAGSGGAVFADGFEGLALATCKSE